jgi:hypothetical protein
VVEALLAYGPHPAFRNVVTEYLRHYNEARPRVLTGRVTEPARNPGSR